jgi:hypothetical protein
VGAATVSPAADADRATPKVTSAAAGFHCTLVSSPSGPARRPASMANSPGVRGEVNRSRRLRGRDGERGIDHRLDLRAVAQLVIPSDELAQHARLVAHLLAPMNIGVARTGKPLFRQRCPAGGDEYRHILAHRIRDAADRVRSSDIHMHHDGRDLPRHHCVAMRHRDCKILMRGEGRPR